MKQFFKTLKSNLFTIVICGAILAIVSVFASFQPEVNVVGEYYQTPAQDIVVEQDTQDQWVFIGELAEGIIRGRDRGCGGFRELYTAVADAGGGYITVTSNGAVNLDEDDWISMVDGVYDGMYQVSNLTINTYDIEATYISDDSGSFIHPAHFMVGKGGKGLYLLSMSGSALTTSVNKKHQISYFKNGVFQVKGKNRRKYAIQDDTGSIDATQIMSLSPGDEVAMAVRSLDTTPADITFKDFNFNITKQFTE